MANSSIDEQTMGIKVDVIALAESMAHLGLRNL